MNIAHLLFPTRCPLCNCVISSKESSCVKCKKSYPKNTYSFIIDRKTICFAPFQYKDAYKLAILKLKFSGRKDIANPMSAEMAKEITREKYFSFDLITFVPLSKNRLKERHYNQSELLAKGVAKRLGNSCMPTLFKIIDNKPQHTLSKEERKENVKNVYKVVDKNNVSNKDILLIDDICTTGATLRECVNMLKKSGAKSVVCLTYTIVSTY